MSVSRMWRGRGRGRGRGWYSPSSCVLAPAHARIIGGGILSSKPSHAHHSGRAEVDKRVTGQAACIIINHQSSIINHQSSIKREVRRHVAPSHAACAHLVCCTAVRLAMMLNRKEKISLLLVMLVGSGVFGLVMPIYRQGAANGREESDEGEEKERIDIMDSVISSLLSSLLSLHCCHHHCNHCHHCHNHLAPG